MQKWTRNIMGRYTKKLLLVFCKIEISYYLGSAGLLFLLIPSLFCQVVLTGCYEATESVVRTSVSEHLKWNEMKNKYFQHISLYLLNNYFMLHTIFDILVVHLGLHIYNTLHENRKKKRGEKKTNTIRDFNISSVFLVTSLNICLTVVFFFFFRSSSFHLSPSLLPQQININCLLPPFLYPFLPPMSQWSLINSSLLPFILS